MKPTLTTCVWGIVIALVMSSRAILGDGTGEASNVRFIRQGDKVLLHASETAAALGWEAKVTASGKLLTLCRHGNDGYCVPVRLDEAVAARTAAGWYVDAATLAAAMRFEWNVGDRGARVVQSNQAAADRSPGLPAYNAEWGEGRGFEVGQTLPDIPLYDLNGRETRFSAFLGKQYIIYCWASW